MSNHSLNAKESLNINVKDVPLFFSTVNLPFICLLKVLTSLRPNESAFI